MYSRILRITAAFVATVVLGIAGMFAAASAASADAGSPGAAKVTNSVITPAWTGSGIATLAKANEGKGPCSTNSLGGSGYETSCNGEEWCADFAKWVWANSGVTVTGLTAAAGSFALYGSGLTSTPAVGDAAVFGYSGGGVAQHVVIVTGVSGSTFTSVGGNENNAVEANGAISTSIGNDQFGQVLSGFVAPDSSSGTHITGWTPGTTCSAAGHQFCLWYAQGQGTGGAGWGSSGSVGTISGTFTIGGSGAAGYGQAVRNNAASMTNVTTNCNVTTWYSPNYTGPYNWLSPDTGGNLTSTLHNNEASISANTCS